MLQTRKTHQIQDVLLHWRLLLARKSPNVNTSSFTYFLRNKKVFHAINSQNFCNELARYLVSKPTTQISIVKNAKSPQKPPIIRYTDARRAIVEHLSDISRSNAPLVAAEQMLLQRSTDPSESSLRQDDATKSIEVLHALPQRLMSKPSIIARLRQFQFERLQNKRTSYPNSIAQFLTAHESSDADLLSSRNQNKGIRRRANRLPKNYAS